MGNRGRAVALAMPSHGRSYSLSLTLPPLGAVFLKPGEESPVLEIAETAATAEASEAAGAEPEELSREE